MIRYMLQCDHAHEFEAWFDKISDYDDQAARGLLECPSCASKAIEKAPMAPAVKRGSALAFEKMAAEIREEISNTSEDVGDKFADEARAIHGGEKPERSIYGQASPKEAVGLIKDGIDIVPLPDAFAPRKSKKLN